MHERARRGDALWDGENMGADRIEGSGLERMMNETATDILARLAVVGVVIAAIVFASVDGRREAIIAGLAISGGVAAMIGCARSGARL